MESDADSSHGAFQEWRGTLKYGILTMAAIGIPIIALFEAGLWAMKYTTAETPPDSQLEMAFLIGLVTALTMTLAVHNVLRTRVVEWFVYFESYVGTLRYPMEGSND